MKKTLAIIGICAGVVSVAALTVLCCLYWKKFSKIWKTVTKILKTFKDKMEAKLFRLKVYMD